MRFVLDFLVWPRILAERQRRTWAHVAWLFAACVWVLPASGVGLPVLLALVAYERAVK